MKSAPLRCDAARLGQLLQGELPFEAEAALLEHLDHCPDCRRRLEDSHGGSAWSSEVQAALCTNAADLDFTPGPLSEFVIGAGSAPGAVLPPRGDGERERAEQSLAALRGMLAPTDDPRMLGRIGAYEVVGIIGRGAMGVVVKAFQPALNRYVAIKVLAPELSVSAAARKRFAREAQAAAAVVHEHVVPIYAVDEFRGAPYLVMQYVAGGSLEKRLAGAGVLTPREALRIGMQIAQGLAAAHQQGLVHRDIKPANILLENGLERVLLTDFGLARAVDDATLTHSGFIAGTPQFMSPEQARGDAVDDRTDLFSLGSVLYTLLTGRPPFRAETAYGLLRRVCDEPHRPVHEVNSDVPEWLSGLVDRLLEKSHEQRLAPAAHVAATLGAALAHVQNPAAHPLPGELRRLTSHSRRTRRARRRAGGLALAATLLLTAAMAMMAWRPPPPREGLGAAGSSPGEEGPHAGKSAAFPATANDSAAVARPVWSAPLGTPQSAAARDGSRETLQVGVPRPEEFDLLFQEAARRVAAVEWQWSIPETPRPDRWRQEMSATSELLRSAESAPGNGGAGQPSGATAVPGAWDSPMSPPLDDPSPTR